MATREERLARLREAVELIKRLWTRDFVTFEGNVLPDRNATTMTDRTNLYQFILVQVDLSQQNSQGELEMALSALLEKAINCTQINSFQQLMKEAKAAGRDPATIERTIEVKVSFDNDRQRALDDTRIWAALALSAEDKVAIHDPREMEQKAETVADQAHRRWLVSNDPDEHAEQIRPYIELGFTHLIFHAPGEDSVTLHATLLKGDLPRLRGRWG